MIQLENDIVRLRALEPSDIELIYRWENDTSVWKVSNTLTPISRHLLMQYLEKAHLDLYEAKQLRMMIELKPTSSRMSHLPIGTLEIFDFDPLHLRAGIGIMIMEKRDRQKGYATEALKILINYVFKYLQLHQLYCNIETSNIASYKLFDNLGFKLIGEKKHWYMTDEGWVNEYMLQLISD